MTTTSMLMSSGGQQQRRPRPRLRGVVFDMDGTLTVPNIDFTEMYRRCGVDPSQDILQVIAQLPTEAERQAKLDIIHDMEHEACQSLQIMPGAPEVLQWLHAHSIPTALVTRNTLRSVQVLQERLLGHMIADSTTTSIQQQQCWFDVIVTRDSHPDVLPAKPDPAALLYICSEQCWKLDNRNDVCMVGDSLEQDVAFGRAAGTTTALLTSEGPTSNFLSGPDITVPKLYNLPRQLWQNFDIESKLGTNVPLLKYGIPQPSNVVTKAAASGDLDTLRSLLSTRCTTSEEQLLILHSPDGSGNTPLIWAADAGNTRIVDFLLQKTATATDNHDILLNARGYLGATALCRAARRGHTAILHKLIAAGACLDIPNEKLQYPLHFAAFKENVAAVELLLQSGVNTRVLDRKGRIPAEDTKDESIRQLILEAMA